MAPGAIAAVTGAYCAVPAHVQGFLFFFLIMPLVIPATWFIGFAIFGHRGRGVGAERRDRSTGRRAFISVAFTLLGTGLLSREPYDLLTLFSNRRRRRSNSP